MKLNHWVVLILLLVLSPDLPTSLFASGPVGNPRIIFSVNEHWNFTFTEDDCDYPSLPEAKWQTKNLPHTWNVNEHLSDTVSYSRGLGWYQKRLNLPENFRGKQVFLHFEGANQITEVLVNGQVAGNHTGGYTAFNVDITSLVHFNQDANIILVKVDNRFNEHIPPLSADFTFYGGIYRDVWLIATDKVHFSLEEYGANGLYVVAPTADSAHGSVLIHGAIKNSSDSSEELVIVNTIYGPDETVVISDEINLSVKVGEQKDFIANEIYISNPELWSPDNPNLYTVRSEIFISGRLTDITFNPLGFRWYDMSADSGFYLNGKSLRLIGTNRHQDHEGYGNALDNRLHIKDLEMIKDAGFNFLRLAHYPQDPSVLDAADRLGLIIWEEIPIVNYITPSEAFFENSRQMLNEMIHQHFNHPSIIFWGYMNEVYLNDADGNRSQHMNFPEEYLNSTVQLAQELDSIVNYLDPDRITVIAAHHSDIYDNTGISEVPDAMGYNLYQGWYSSHFEDFGKYLDKMHSDFVNRKIIVSEYGAGSDERIHSEEPQRFDFSIEYQQLLHESYLKQIIDRPYLVGTAAWAQNDFGSDRRGDTKAKINQKGLQYFNRQPKDIYYLYKSVLSNIPIVHFASHDWKTRYRSAGNYIYPMKVYSNLPVLDIYIDRKPIGSFEIDESGILNLDLNLSIGNHFIEAKGKSNTSVYSDQLELLVIEDKIPCCIVDKNQIDICVNVGSLGQYQDQTGSIWRRDREYSNGGFGYTEGKPRPIYGSRSVLGTVNDPVFQTYRQGLTSYRFDVPSGLYEVELCFAELEHQKVDERVMDISINGSSIWEDLDLVKNYGYLYAVSRTFEIYINDQQNIEITLDAKRGISILNGVRIRRK